MTIALLSIVILASIVGSIVAAVAIHRRNNP